MFVGHFGVAFAAKRVAPRASLPLLLAAGGFLDLLWPVLLLAGIERVRIDPGNTAFTPLDFLSYPWSHSAATTLLWAALFGVAVLAVTRDRATALVTAALVASHWVLDVVSHRPDLPLWPGGPKAGLGLWSSIAATLLVEGAIFLGGVWIYVRATRARGAAGRWGLAALVLLLAASYVADASSGAPPPSTEAIAWVNLGGMAITLALAAWADRRRTATV
ncbi:MAG TPA: hypothetical protein VEB43_17030 [Anaeromyxobacter sp.]|nr:hypothetical protein [Anaeromyxobacter sp.]